MKTILLSLIVASGLLMADIAENKEFCADLRLSLPSVIKVGLDAFAKHDGNASKCEDHTREEWRDISASKHFGILMGIYTLTMGGTCSYEYYAKQLENREHTPEEMKNFLEKVKKECAQDEFKKENK